MREVGAYEAKTHLARLLDEVERGESIVITRRGVLVAILSPARRQDREKVAQGLARLDAIRERSKAGPESVRDLIEEGRRL